jgi:hypothetical protein
MGKNDTTVLLASVSDVALGNLIRIEDEFMRIMPPLSTAATTPQLVLRGQEGTAQVAHPSGAKVLLGANPSNLVAGDWGNPSAQQAAPVINPLIRVRRRLSYAAAGAITLPNVGEDMEAEILGTNALAMTLANPTKLQDGDTLRIKSDGKAAHTVTYSAGLGNGGASFDVATFPSGLQTSIILVAQGGFWIPTSFTGATGAAGAPTVA